MSNNNKESLESAIQTLNQLATSHSTPKNFKKTITDLMTELNQMNIQSQLEQPTQ